MIEDLDVHRSVILMLGRTIGYPVGSVKLRNLYFILCYRVEENDIHYLYQDNIYVSRAANILYDRIVDSHFL